MALAARLNWTIFAFVAIAVGSLAPSAALAQAWWDSVENGIPQPSFANSLPANGDPYRVRKWLSDRGIVYGVEYTNDALANLRGGLRTGPIDQGKLQGILTVDFEKMLGLKGLSFFANFFYIHNTGLIRREYVGGLNTIAAIEALPSTRLSELWLEQKFASDMASLRIGQLTADSEFFYSETSLLFLQSDWPTIAAVNLPSGGAAYPLSTPGVRLKFDPTKDVSLLFAVLNGDPAGPPPPNDEQVRNCCGLNFRMRDPPFIIGEIQAKANQGKEDSGLARTLKVGFWRHTGRFDDQRLGYNGFLLADPLSSGIPLTHRGNSGLYAIIDQQIYRPQGGDAKSGITAFSRVSVSPTDRNVVNAYIDGGVVFAGFIPSRPDDKFGAGFIYARFSNSVRDFDRDTIAFTGMPGVVRDFEANLELTYQAQIVPGWWVQPVVTRVWHPNGDASRNALVAGARSLWRY
jgi:porin